MSDEGDNKQASGWLASHWVMIVMMIVGGILILGFLSVLRQMFSGVSPNIQGLMKSI